VGVGVELELGLGLGLLGAVPTKSPGAYALEGHLQALDGVFVRCCEYWLALETTLDVARQRNEIIHRMLRPAGRSALPRLEDMALFWRCFAFQAEAYVKQPRVPYEFLSPDVTLASM
jgi:hypothetical protein